MSKGSLRRPLQVTDQEAEDNWNRIFGKKEHYNQLLEDNEDGFNPKENQHVRQETKRQQKT